jgi:hypothetical protein
MTFERTTIISNRELALVALFKLDREHFDRAKHADELAVAAETEGWRIKMHAKGGPKVKNPRPITLARLGAPGGTPHGHVEPPRAIPLPRGPLRRRSGAAKGK